MDIEAILTAGKPLVIHEVEFMSAGHIDYGNNDIWEVLLPKVRPTDADGDFVQSNYDVYFIEHQNYPHELTTRHDFFKQVPYGHFNLAVIQLGEILSDYDEQNGVEP